MGVVFEEKRNGYRARRRGKNSFDKRFLVADFDNKEAAKNAANTYWNNQITAIKQHGTTCATMSEMMQRYIVDNSEIGLASKSQGYQSLNRGLLLDFWDPALGHFALFEMETNGAAHIANALRNATFNADKRRKALNALSAVFRLAGSSGLISINPALVITKPPAPPRRTNSYNKDTIRNILETAYDYGRKPVSKRAKHQNLNGVPLFFWFAIVTGQRTTAISRIRMEHIDFIKKTVTFPAGNQKNKKPLVFQLPDDLWKVPDLVGGLDSTPCTKPLHKKCKTHNIIPFANVYPHINPVLEKLGIPTGKGHIHALRRSLVTHLVREGVEVSQIAGMLNMSSQMVLRYCMDAGKQSPRAKSALAAYSSPDGGPATDLSSASIDELLAEIAKRAR